MFWTSCLLLQYRLYWSLPPLLCLHQHWWPYHHYQHDHRHHQEEENSLFFFHFCFRITFISIFDEVRTRMESRLPQSPSTETRGTNTPCKQVVFYSFLLKAPENPFCLGKILTWCWGFKVIYLLNFVLKGPFLALKSQKKYSGAFINTSEIPKD